MDEPKGLSWSFIQVLLGPIAAKLAWTSWPRSLGGLGWCLTLWYLEIALARFSQRLRRSRCLILMPTSLIKFSLLSRAHPVRERESRAELFSTRGGGGMFSHVTKREMAPINFPVGHNTQKWTRMKKMLQVWQQNLLKSHHYILRANHEDEM